MKAIVSNTHYILCSNLSKPLHKMPQTLNDFKHVTSSPGRFSLALGAKAKEKRPGDEVVRHGAHSEYMNLFIISFSSCLINKHISHILRNQIGPWLKDIT